MTHTRQVGERSSWQLVAGVTFGVALLLLTWGCGDDGPHPNPLIRFDVDSVYFDPNGLPQSLGIENEGKSAGDFVVRGAPSWCIITPDSGSLAVGATTTVTVSVSCEGKNPDSYTCTLYLASDGDVTDSCRIIMVCGPIRSGLVAYWALDEASGSMVVDSSDNHLDGTATGTTVVDGVRGKARHFAGYPAGIEVPHNDVLNINGSITIMLWVKVDPANAEGFLISKRLESGAQCEINYNIKASITPGHNFLAFQYGTGCATGSTYMVTDLPGLGDGNWHHAAISFVFGNPSSAKWVYDDALRSGTWTHWDGTPGGGTEIPPTNSYPLTIAHQLSTSPGYFKGALDQIRIYDQALSVDSIRTAYQEERPTVL